MNDDIPVANPQAAYPPPRRKAPSRLWLLASVILGLGLALSLFFNLILSLAVVGNAAGQVTTPGFTPSLVDGEASAKDVIAIVPVQGMIMEPPSDNPSKGSYAQMSKLLKLLRKEENLKGVLLVVDSPGGGVTASDRMYEELRRFKLEKKVPVVAVFEDVAASGGYYVAMAADHILAHPTTVTGSIGVISHFYNLTELMGRLGVQVNVIKSLNSEGRESFKDMGSPYRKMRPEEKKLLQQLITEMWNRFTAVVAEGRKGKLSPERIKQLADGRVFTGQQALREKLVDEVGYMPEAYKAIRAKAGSPDAKIVRYVADKSWSDLFSAEAERVQPKLELPRSRIMYLWDPR